MDKSGSSMRVPVCGAPMKIFSYLQHLGLFKLFLEYYLK